VLPTSDDSTATRISVSSTSSAVPPVPALDHNTTPKNPVIAVIPTSDDSATAHISVPSTSLAAPNLAEQSDDDMQQLLLANRTTQIRTRRAAAYWGHVAQAERVVKCTRFESWCYGRQRCCSSTGLLIGIYLATLWIENWTRTNTQLLYRRGFWMALIPGTNSTSVRNHP